MILLTPEERDRFATYLEQDAMGTKGIIEQMKRVAVPEVLIVKLKNEAVASLIVAAKLRTTADEWIG